VLRFAHVAPAPRVSGAALRLHRRGREPPRDLAAEARTIIDAPAERVAQLVGDPAAFAELLPAAEVRLLGSEGGAQLVQLERREPWPVGVVRWTEAVRRRRDGQAYLVERQARGEGYFRRLEASWSITPVGEARCAVVYRVSMELRRWVPTWMLRRGNASGMLGTIARLRRMSERVSS
jgi:ribosome-associated toxin RatA of RatAB toxin-antitoxin module